MSPVRLTLRRRHEENADGAHTTRGTGALYHRDHLRHVDERRTGGQPLCEPDGQRHELQSGDAVQHRHRDQRCQRERRRHDRARHVWIARDATVHAADGLGRHHDPRASGAVPTGDLHERQPGNRDLAWKRAQRRRRRGQQLVDPRVCDRGRLATGDDRSRHRACPWPQHRGRMHGDRLAGRQRLLVVRTERLRRARRGQRTRSHSPPPCATTRWSRRIRAASARSRTRAAAGRSR